MNNDVDVEKNQDNESGSSPPPPPQPTKITAFNVGNNNHRMYPNHLYPIYMTIILCLFPSSSK
ncbi:hypothetical protein DERF_013053 [Dermatophagoides farinae]|uniref:Uncharacterized protein n=1 Tax=Dermatophagoides farinae TaxID=6954 RepID=A0A922L1Y7_DERFA|nr:hypothetical protein DERF_013053 [Dermatophagoides farinae]